MNIIAMIKFQIIKKYIILVLLLSLNLLLNKCFSKKVTMLEDINKVELFFTVEDFKTVPEDIRKKMILKKKMNKRFLNDINKLKLISGEFIFVFCHEIKIYGHESVITFETNGYIFYDRKNNLLYKSDKNLLEKYWNLLEENACR
jgi:hypothetical protein